MCAFFVFSLLSYVYLSFFEWYIHVSDRSFAIGEVEGDGGALVASEWGPCQKIRLRRAGLAKKY